MGWSGGNLVLDRKVSLSIGVSFTSEELVKDKRAREIGDYLKIIKYRNDSGKEMDGWNECCRDICYCCRLISLAPHHHLIISPVKRFNSSQRNN